MSITKKQVEYLKALGYTDTQEDGALLEHPRIEGLCKYVWKDDTVFDVLAAHTGAVRKTAINDVAAAAIKQLL